MALQRCLVALEEMPSQEGSARGSQEVSRGLGRVPPDPRAPSPGLDVQPLDSAGPDLLPGQAALPPAPALRDPRPRNPTPPRAGPTGPTRASGSPRAQRANRQAASAPQRSAPLPPAAVGLTGPGLRRGAGVGRCGTASGASGAGASCRRCQWSPSGSRRLTAAPPPPAPAPRPPIGSARPGPPPGEAAADPPLCFVFPLLAVPPPLSAPTSLSQPALSRLPEPTSSAARGEGTTAGTESQISGGDEFSLRSTRKALPARTFRNGLGLYCLGLPVSRCERSPISSAPFLRS
ncbi:collagen alpha-1(I) chain [Mus musculus]|uniref:collagen alpha-1(I) chain n=1 Tax=Mus musculus TaxID=10090 RepID=UPI0011AE3B27|nr:collagen alpha-1(I) chain [Mus musculus]